jgi:hypothetical protein
MPDQLDYFISFGGPDEKWADWVARVLIEDGARVLVQSLDMRAGQNIVHQTQLGTSAKRTIMIMSPDYFGRSFPEAEWAAAFFQDPVGLAGKLVPVMVRTCEPPGLLASIVYINLVDRPEEEAREILLERLAPNDGTWKTPPPFPGKA